MEKERSTTLPQQFIDKYQLLLGEEASEFFSAIEHGISQKGFRWNPLKPAGLEMVRKYHEEKSQPAPYSKEGFLSPVDGKTPLHQAGYVYSQEPSAMLPAAVADPRPGERILDLCAAPGGKTTQLAAQMQGKGLLVSNEIFPKRAKILSENVERWGITNAVVTNQAPVELVPHFNGFFDKIVVDAPCSGEGMFRKDPKAIAEWTEETPLQCQERQKDILQSAMKMIKTNGTLIYSTCTFAPEENEQIISWLVENYPVSIEGIDMARVSHGRPEWGSVDGLEKTVRLWPHKGQGEGHFVAKLVFHGETESPSEKKPAKKQRKQQDKTRLTKEQQSIWQAFAADFQYETSGELRVFHDHLWELPANAPSLSGLKILREGLHLGVFKKNRFEPSYALALAMKNTENIPSLQISEAEWRAYVAGETFQAKGNAGWVLLMRDQIPVGFGKQVQGVVKNFFPKGLRFH
ncbi:MULTISPECIES: RsmB/NOP family class I SAM-dependent RNA methyltransferase [unclassified Enterococcus]|uniref:RsmF rRNA methyltransferase first C-terminal domain-containing protein n=1 Tax=unclassified Enterococcus TaxID=2608891 RepID=UPI0013EE1620|nr:MULTISPECIES: RsmB/NOP family class I SAM-dependent RNA methyltransferase [unclassified Enterococcus]